MLTYLFLSNMGDKPLEKPAYLLVTGICLLILLLFFGMTTRIDSKSITISFGIGLIKKKILLDNIVAVRVVQNPWFWGWGIRMIPNGTLYNISGVKGIELKFKNTDKIIRIGSKDPETLKSEIDTRSIN
ncbi:MAG: hypothetical protein IM600_17260 [Bacteroidetes bacterium]|jgi:hypothetical protein|nr:hypothetical protein [Bacteroidota bacterium]